MKHLINLLIFFFFISCHHPKELKTNSLINSSAQSDSPFLQSLIDSLDIVQIPSGEWNISKHLILKSGKHLIGLPGAILYHTSGPKQTTILAVQSNTIVENLTFRSINDQKYWYIPTLSTLTSNVTHLVIEAGAKNVTIRNCRFVGAEFGITCSYLQGNPIDNIVIDNVTIDSSFMSMLLTGVDRAFVTNYRSDKRHITERDQRIGHHSYFEGVKKLFISDYHAVGGCCDALKLRNTVLDNITTELSNITIDSTGPLKIDFAGDVNIADITFRGNQETIWPAGFKTLLINNMVVEGIESTTAFTRIITAGGNSLPQGETLKINGLTTYGPVSMELTKIKRVFLDNVTMINPLYGEFKAVPIKVPFIPQDPYASTQFIMINNMYVRQDRNEAQGQFIEIKPQGNTGVIISNSYFDFNGHRIDWFMKADNTNELSFQNVNYNSVIEFTGYDNGAKASFKFKTD